MKLLIDKVYGKKIEIIVFGGIILSDAKNDKTLNDKKRNVHTSSNIKTTWRSIILIENLRSHESILCHNYLIKITKNALFNSDSANCFISIY